MKVEPHDLDVGWQIDAGQFALALRPRAGGSEHHPHVEPTNSLHQCWVITELQPCRAHQPHRIGAGSGARREELGIDHEWNECHSW